MRCAPTLTTLTSNFPPQIQNILFDGFGELSLAGVDMRHRPRPGFREGQWQVDDVAFLDVSRVEKRGQDGEECACIGQVCLALLAGFHVGRSGVARNYLRIGTVLVFLTWDLSRSRPCLALAAIDERRRLAGRGLRLANSFESLRAPADTGDCSGMMALSSSISNVRRSRKGFRSSAHGLTRTRIVTWFLPPPDDSSFAAAPSSAEELSLCLRRATADTKQSAMSTFPK